MTFDLDSGEATIAGRGHITIRVKGDSAIVEAGEAVPTSYLLELAAGLAEGTKGTDSAGGNRRPAEWTQSRPTVRPPGTSDRRR